MFGLSCLPARAAAFRCPYAEMLVSLIWPKQYWESMVGSVIQATGTVEFEDGLWIGNHLKPQNGL